MGTRHSLLRNATKGVARGRVEIGSQNRVRRPTPWVVQKIGGQFGTVLGWVVGAVLGLECLISLLNASLRSVNHLCNGDARGSYSLRSGNVAFLKGSDQLPPEMWSLVERVELRFQSSKGDHFRTRVVSTRVQRPPDRARGSGGAEVMIEQLSYSFSCPPTPRWLLLVSVAAVGPCGRTRQRGSRSKCWCGGLAGLGVCVALPSHWGRHSLGSDWGTAYAQTPRESYLRGRRNCVADELELAPRKQPPSDLPQLELLPRSVSRSAQN